MKKNCFPAAIATFVVVGFFLLIPLAAGQAQQQDAFARHPGKVSLSVLSRIAEDSGAPVQGIVSGQGRSGPDLGSQRKTTDLPSSDQRTARTLHSGGSYVIRQDLQTAF